MAIASLADIVREHASTQPDKAAIVLGDRTVSYAQLLEESAKVAQALTAAGIGSGDRVAILDKNSIEYYTLLFGASMCNAVTVAVNWRLAPGEVEYIVNDAESKVLLIGPEFAGHLESMNLTTVTKTVSLGTDGELTYDAWIADHDAVDPMTPSSLQDTAFQLYTSGTTGLPKGVELSNHNFFVMIPIAGEAWSLDAESVNLCAMPQFHIAGTGWGVVGFYFGGTNVVLRELDLELLLSLIEDYKITNALLVPAALQFVLLTPKAQETDFSSMRAVVYGASPITEEVLVGSMNLMGCDFVQVYGLTETTGAVTQLDAADHDPGGPRADLLRSAGKPFPGAEVRIVDAETGDDMPVGEVGEIWIRTPQNMKGYWKNDAATAEAFPGGRDADGTGGWFRSGDAGFLKDGFIFIHDRVKDMIVSGGENVYPAEIENALMGHPAVADCAVIGVPSEKWGETPKALIIATPDTDPTEAEIIAYCREKIARFKCPTSVERIAAIPRNPSGKILKVELRKPYWEGHDRNVG